MYVWMEHKPVKFQYWILQDKVFFKFLKIFFLIIFVCLVYDRGGTDCLYFSQPLGGY